MNRLTLIKQSIFFYRRQYLGIFLGTALAAAVLTGALLAGDTVKYSLNRLVDLRLGKIEYALAPPERFFTVDLARGLSAGLGTNTAPVLRVAGIAVAGEADMRVNNVQVLGIDDRFSGLGLDPTPNMEVQGNEAVINAPLARRLNLAQGQELVLLMGRPEAMPGDAPFSNPEDSISLRLTVRSVLADEHMGRFSLDNNQVSPLNVFLSLETLQKRLKLEEKANLILLGGRPSHTLDLAELQAALKARITLSDLGAKIKEVDNGSFFDLVSQRIFIEPALEQAVLSLAYPAKPVLSYFVNSIDFQGKSTPYSLVSSPGPPPAGDTLAADEIIISRWLADDLAAGPGDKITLKYFIPGAGGTLEEYTAPFTIQSVAAIEPDAYMRSLLPDFPGLSGVKNCRDWRPGINIDLGRIRKKDEDYWNACGGTPKAFIKLVSAQNLWQNRFGRLTAVRFSASTADPGQVGRELLQNLDPAAFGFVFQPVRDQALAAAGGGVDFGQLFLGLSLFIIISALVLSSMLNIFHRQSRLAETGILKAVGIGSGIRRFLAVGEGAVIAFTASGLGVLLAILYTQLLILGLDTIWQGAVGQISLHFNLNPGALATGFGLSLLACLLSLWLPLRRDAAKSTALLLSQTMAYDAPTRKKAGQSTAAGGACLVLIAALLLLSGRLPGLATAFFFAIGILALCAFLFFLNTVFSLVNRKKSSGRPSLLRIALQNTARRKKSSLATVNLLGIGIFCVIAVGANQEDLATGFADRSSGTGGFALYGETTRPLPSSLNDPGVKSKLHLDETRLYGAAFVQLKVRNGDDASCLNLNKVAAPRLLGIDPHELDKRNAFSFAAFTPELAGAHPWLGLGRELEQGVIPAIADQTVILWGLGKNLGDELKLLNEQGEEIRLKLVGGLKNSVFQGSVLIAEDIFVKHFPSVSGYQLFLADGPGTPEPAGRTLASSLKAYGLELSTTESRLARFHAVENTYLLMFLLLGGLALIIGSMGLGVIILRNTAESRNQYALLQALGFSRNSIILLVIYEHMFLLLASIICGGLAAFLALLPQLAGTTLNAPLAWAGILLLSLFLNGSLWLYLGARAALKGDLLSALRNE